MGQDSVPPRDAAALREDESGRFSLTALGHCLRSDDPDGTRAMILGWTCL
jgi:hypothetical protein